MGPKGVPKRKSLTGLFGLSVTRSKDDIRKQSPTSASSSGFAPWKLKSLAEEREETIHRAPPKPQKANDPFVVSPVKGETPRTQKKLQAEREYSITDVSNQIDPSANPVREPSPRRLGNGSFAQSRLPL
jgi:hypothetical protein